MKLFAPFQIYQSNIIYAINIDDEQLELEELDDELDDDELELEELLEEDDELEQLYVYVKLKDFLFPELAA